VLIARHTDVDPVGSADYKRTLAMLVRDGQAQFLRTITSPSWQFVHDQWETQIWGRILDVLGSPRNLIYCSLEIPPEQYRDLPCRPGTELASEADRRAAGAEPEQQMTLVAGRAVRAAVAELTQRLGRPPEVLFLRDGPYGVPEWAAGEGR
jgi:hypothetical protein